MERDEQEIIEDGAEEESFAPDHPVEDDKYRYKVSENPCDLGDHDWENTWVFGRHRCSICGTVRDVK